MTQDAVHVAFNGTVNREDRCAGCNGGMLYRVMGGRVVAMFCGNVGCFHWLQQIPTSGGEYCITHGLYQSQHVKAARVDSVEPPASQPWECAARKQGTAGGNLPADCNWPMCGCDPYAEKVLAALEEAGALKDKVIEHAPGCSGKTVRCECGAQVCNCNLLGHVGCASQEGPSEIEKLKDAIENLLVRVDGHEISASNASFVADGLIDSTLSSATDAAYERAIDRMEDLAWPNAASAIRSLKGGK